MTLAARLRHAVLPALTLSITGVAGIALHTREKMCDVMESDYVLFARARGESRAAIVLRLSLIHILLALILVLLPFFSSMLITNDVSLITFVPFTILVLGLIGRTRERIYLIVLQTVAANLGSMAMPRCV